MCQARWLQCGSFSDLAVWKGKEGLVKSLFWVVTLSGSGLGPPATGHWRGGGAGADSAWGPHRVSSGEHRPQSPSGKWVVEGAPTPAPPCGGDSVRAASRAQASTVAG
jgi:hypothetical protein